MGASVYSFADYTVTFSHKSFGQYVASGNSEFNTANISNGNAGPIPGDNLGGIGSISVVMANDLTTHDIGVDGTALIRRTLTTNGNLVVSVQQTSYLNVWLTKLYAYLITVDASYWAGMSVQINAGPRPGMDAMIFANRVAIQKVPDRAFAANGGQVAWTLMAGDILRWKM